MGELLNRMARKMHQYAAIGAEVEAFIAGVDTLRELDAEADDLVRKFSTPTAQRKHREFMGVVVIASRKSRKLSLEIVVRHSSGPAMVEPIR